MACGDQPHALELKTLRTPRSDQHQGTHWWLDSQKARGHPQEFAPPAKRKGILFWNARVVDDDFHSLWICTVSPFSLSEREAPEQAEHRESADHFLQPVADGGVGRVGSFIIPTLIEMEWNQSLSGKITIGHPKSWTYRKYNLYSIYIHNIHPGFWSQTCPPYPHAFPSQRRAM